ncbi:MAG: Crp/Fnr family transcriptional regulator [Fibrobacteraceae bacterium]
MEILEELARLFPVWDKLSVAERESLAAAVHTRRFSKGENIHGTGESCLGFLILKSGRLRAYLLSDSGREVTLYYLNAGEMCLFSASCMMRNIQFDIYIDAKEDTDVLQIPAPAFKNLMEKSLPVSRYVNDLMATHLTDVMWLMEQILFKRLDERLAALLLEDAKGSPENAVTATHEELAERLGSAREAVTRMLKYFQTEKLVKLSRGEIRITDPAALSAVIAEPRT